MYGYFALLFFLKSRYLDADGSYVDLPSEVDKMWNPADDFFDENYKDPTHFDPHLESNDKFREHIDVKTQSIESVDSVEHIKETLMTTDIQSLPLRKNNKNNKEDLKYKAYFTRFIKIFLRETGLEEGKVEDSKTVTVDIILSKRDLAILENFGSDNDITFDALEKSFGSIFHPIVKSSILNMISDSMPELNKYVLIASLIVGVVYFIHLTLKFQFSKTLIILAILFVYLSIVSLDLLQQYEDVTEKMIIKRMEFSDLSDPPKACFVSKLNIFEKFYYHLMGDDICQKFLDSRKSVWYNIDVVEAFSKPFTSIVLRLCSLIGESAERLVEPINAKCPWPLNIILNCMMSILRLPILFFLFCIIISALYKGRISLKMPFFSLNSGRNESFNDSRKTLREGLEERQGGRTVITNHSGGIILMENKDSSIDYGINKENLNFQLAKHLGANTSTNLRELSLNSRDDSNKNIFPIFHSLSSTTPGKVHVFNRQQILLDEKVKVITNKWANTSTNSRELSLNSRDDSNKNIFPISHSLSSTTPGNVFNRQQKLLDEKVKLKKNKFFKKRHNLKNITDESIKDICKLHVTK